MNERNQLRHFSDQVKINLSNNSSKIKLYTSGQPISKMSTIEDLCSKFSYKS